jgi:hypothetical protein
MKLQVVLMEVISHDQSTFLPFRFILNNIFLVHKTIMWAKKSKQPLIFVILDFFKVYGRVDWNFLFNCMNKLGILMEFVNMTIMKE